jgi:alpha-tubulin suppressor-like RCC1 family protein
LGDGITGGSEEVQSTPGEVKGIRKATQVSAAGYDTCALLSSGHIDCWGENSAGQLGNGSESTDQDAPVEVKGVVDGTQISTGVDYSCALLSSAAIDCWGWNYDGELGDGTTTSSSTPVEVHDISDATSVAAGTADTCARLSSSTVDCWGEGYYGQLGDGVLGYWLTPVEAVVSE